MVNDGHARTDSPTCARPQEGHHLDERQVTVSIVSIVMNDTVPKLIIRQSHLQSRSWPFMADRRRRRASGSPTWTRSRPLPNACGVTWKVWGVGWQPPLAQVGRLPIGSREPGASSVACLPW